MDHRPSPSEVSQIEQEAKKQNQEERDARQEVNSLMNHTTPQRKQYFSEQEKMIKEE